LFHVTPRKETSDVIEPFQTHRQNDARRRVICRRWSTTASGDLATVATRQRPQGPVDAALKQPLFCATVCSPTSLLHSRLDTNLWLNCRASDFNICGPRTRRHCYRRVHPGACETLEVILAHRLHFGWR
jgi:hypothetical protein